MIINNINTEDISVVVQGAVEKKYTCQCLNSVRENLPGAEIILSTWEGSDVTGLDYDILVLNKDPGASIYDFNNIVFNNINRQLVSTKQGLAKVKRKYAIKMRSDIVLESPAFLDYFDKFQRTEDNYRVFKSRLITLTLYSRRFHINRIKKVYTPFYCSDWFQFGYSDDIKEYFNTNIIKDLTQFGQYFYQSPEKWDELPFETLMAKFTPEQYYCSEFVKRHFPNVKFDDILDVNKEIIQFSNRVLVNNFVFLDYSKSTIYCSKWDFISKSERNMLINDTLGFIYYNDFLYDYKKYCDKSFKLSWSKKDYWNYFWRRILQYIVADLIHLKQNVKTFVCPINKQIKNVGHKFKNVIKNILKHCNPAYKVSSDVREMINCCLVQNQQILNYQNELAVSKRNIRKVKAQTETLQRVMEQTQAEVLEIMQSVRSFQQEISDMKQIVPFYFTTDNHSAEGTTQQNKTEKDYLSMQKDSYEDKSVPSEFIVGQYQWHEQFPYETFLLYKYGDVRSPIFEDFKDKRALDFACGPGRMVKRMHKIFAEVDGCDISKRLIDEAKQNVPDSKFYVTNGNDLGDTPNNHYDFVYCTISMQHIASHTIRMQIIKQIHDALRQGGCVTLQMAYNPDFPYVQEIAKDTINSNQVTVRTVLDQANYMDDDYDAATTNGGHDVGIGKKDLPALRKDFETLFSDVNFWFATVDNYYENFKGEHHVPYWATDWIFIYGVKK